MTTKARRAIAKAIKALNEADAELSAVPANIPSLGGIARAAATPPARRREIAQNAARARWDGKAKP